MRVISGSAKGRKLESPKNYDIRPTGEMVKEAVFSIIQVKVPEARVLDLFSGTGQLGIEALSRGADFCVFVDESRDMLALTERNIARAGFQKLSKTVCADALKYIENSERADIIFIDPPYDANLTEKILEKIIEFDILREHGIIICESRVMREMPDLNPPYNKMREYRYGNKKITLYKKEIIA
ncbi:MAG: 16S rRNA (guanine(966)-N(2))-methyltransferase RsmD [Clostridiales bacterium]|nr:16S rRNA (guanine(966)-N(2))-methyltransferase RsmD [Clostridiales bacterium]